MELVKNRGAAHPPRPEGMPPRHTITNAMALMLIYLWHRKDRVVDVSDAPPHCGGIERLVWWGLVEPSRKKGYWRLTREGRQFVRNKLTVPRYAIENEDGVTFPDETDRISIEDALTGRFSYKYLMS